MRLLIIFLFLIMLFPLLVISNNNFNLQEKEDSEKFFNISKSWINETYLNLQKISGQIIKMNWTP
jgi:ribosomal 50S subunit-associated protein YjgA (DUF615 family)